MSNENLNPETITLGAGCFWCVEAVFQQLDGVVLVESGYSGGKTENPTYKQICGGNTGHAEVIQIKFNRDKISLKEILDVFWRVHDPTTLNRQGNDEGTQYRSAIFYHNPEQKQVAELSKSEANKAGLWENPIVTEISPFTKFYKAEDYHQNYYNDNPFQPYCSFVISPKVKKFKKEFQDKLKK
jgi:peptide-methionine (S)-S-oxide reductase